MFFSISLLLLLLLQKDLTSALIVPKYHRKKAATVLKSTYVKEQEREISLYQVLGIPRHASKSDIKQAFRQKARQYHPDVNHNPDSTELFQNVNHAYQILNDPGLKLQYDLFGPPEDESPSSFQARTQSALGQEGPGPAKLAQASTIPGDDLQFYLQVGFRMAAAGGSVKIPIRRLETCETCRGKELQPGSMLYDDPCNNCYGRGRILQMYRNPLGHIVEEVEDCTVCRGRKNRIEAFCACCQGTGHRMMHREVILEIPPGVRNGQVLRLPKCGNAGPKGGPLGDVFIFVTVKPPSMFVRQSLNV